MQRSLDEAQARSYETARKLDRVLGEYVDSSKKELGRPHHIMNKMWQMMQSRDTKVKQARWNESTKATGFWRQDEDEDQ